MRLKLPEVGPTYVNNMAISFGLIWFSRGFSSKSLVKQAKWLAWKEWKEGKKGVEVREKEKGGGNTVRTAQLIVRVFIFLYLPDYWQEGTLLSSSSLRDGRSIFRTAFPAAPFHSLPVLSVPIHRYLYSSSGHYHSLLWTARLEADQKMPQS